MSTKADVARIFRVSLPTVDAWVRSGCPFSRKGSRGHAWEFDLAEVVSWRFSRVSNSEAGSLTQAQTKRTIIDCEHRELRLKRDRAELVSIDTVILEWSRLFQVFKSKIRAIPRKLSPFLATETDAIRVEGILQKDINEVLTVLGDYDPSKPSGGVS